MSEIPPLLNRQRATEIMTELGLSALVASTPQNVHYTAGYHSHGQWLMPGSHALTVLPKRQDLPITLIVSVSELDRVAEEPPAAGRIAPYGHFVVAQNDQIELDALDRSIIEARQTTWHSSPAAALATVLGDYSLSSARIGLDERGLLPTIRDDIRSQLPSADLVDGYGPLQRVRMVKTPAEVALLERAVRVSETALTTVISAFRPGITERELVRIYENVVLDLGARPTFSHILVGKRGALSNGGVSAAALAPGDVVRFDVGCSVGSYNADIARTAVFGKASDQVRTYYSAILEGEEQALAMIKPGVKASDLFERAIEATRQAGIGHYGRNHVGHGIGIELYDPPVITATTTTELEEGMVLNLETPYYELGWGGLQVEDTFVVREDGPQLLTTISRELIEMS